MLKNVVALLEKDHEKRELKHTAVTDELKAQLNTERCLIGMGVTNGP